LSEAYDNSAIVGHTITVRATGLNGTASVAVVASTNAAGVASFVLPVGEYQVTAEYGGAAMYLPSSVQQSPVYVYRPTTFVIWGGNADGIVGGARYQFWGQGWARQVVSGKFEGNPSFQGFAVPVNEATWENPPASSGHGPASVPDLISVIVTTEVTGRGSRTTGNIAAFAVLRVDDPAAYRPDGGHGATGVVRVQLP
jgi:hypothetical protein